MESMAVLFHSEFYVISGSAIGRSGMLLQTMRSISFSNDTQMPIGTRQETNI